MRRMFSENQLKNQVKNVIESGEVENAKPIYYHGIRLATEASETQKESRLTFVILNNDPTPFTRLTFVNYITTLMDTYDATIQVNGYFVQGTTVCNAYEVSKASGTGYRIYGNTTAGRTSEAMENVINVSVGTLTDGVNKLN